MGFTHAISNSNVSFIFILNPTSWSVGDMTMQIFGLTNLLPQTGRLPGVSAVINMPPRRIKRREKEFYTGVICTYLKQEAISSYQIKS